MERVPSYLLVHLWKIRKHSCEGGYPKKLVEGTNADRAVYENDMLKQMFELRLIALFEDTDEVVFGPLEEEVSPGHIVLRAGTESRISVPHVFQMLSRGHYIWMELLVEPLKWVLASFLGAAIALLVSSL